MTSSPFHKDEIVWAKVEGHPWWPAVVAEVQQGAPDEEMLVLVNFVGEQSHAKLPLKKVVKYSDLHEQMAKTKKKTLLQAITTADRIERGETTYEGTVLS